MDARQQFKVAFLRACADQGLSIDETIGRAEKAAALIEKDAFWPAIGVGAGMLGKGLFIDVPRTALSAALPYALGGAALAGVGVPLIGGVAGGIALQRATSDDTNIEEAKANELIEEYDRLAEQARRHAAMRQYATHVLPHSGRRF